MYVVPMNRNSLTKLAISGVFEAFRDLGCRVSGGVLMGFWVLRIRYLTHKYLEIS